MINIFVLGDIHGNFKPVRNLYSNYKDFSLSRDSKKNILILLGDAGLNYFLNERDRRAKKQLEKYPFTYFVIRGNHEERPSILAEKNPNNWSKEDFWGNKVWIENDFPYIKYAMDYVSIYSIPYGKSNIKSISGYGNIPLTYKILVVPGAYSVDKEIRLKNNWNWFPREQLSEEEKKQGLELIQNNNLFDFILSHTCPIELEPRDLFLSTVVQSEVDKSMENYLSEITKNTFYKAHLWGHYHAYREYDRKIPSWGNPRNIMLYDDFAIKLDDILTREDIPVYMTGYQFKED